MALKLGEAFALVGVKTGAFDRGMRGVAARFRSGLNQMQAVASRYAGLIGAALGAGTLAWIVKVSAGFEQSMNRVRAISGATGTDMAALTETARQLGKTTMFTARQAAEAMGFFALAGFKAKEIIAAMRPTLDLAAVGQLDMATAADIVAKSMKGMGLGSGEVGHLVDVLAKAMTSANTDLSQLGEGLKHVGRVATEAGWSMERTVSAVMALQDAGFVGSMAGTSLRNIIIRLSGGIKEANKVFKKYGIEIVDAGGKTRDLSDIVADMNAAFADVGSAQKMADVIGAFGARGGPQFLALMSIGAERIRGFEQAMKGADGTGREMADIMMKGLTGKFVELKSALEGLAITLGNVLLPYLTDFAKQLKGLTGGADEAAASTDALVKNVGTLADVLAILYRSLRSVMSGLRGMVAGTAMVLDKTYELTGAYKIMPEQVAAAYKAAAKAAVEAAEESLAALTELWKEPLPSTRVRGPGKAAPPGAAKPTGPPATEAEPGWGLTIAGALKLQAKRERLGREAREEQRRQARRFASEIGGLWWLGKERIAGTIGLKRTEMGIAAAQERLAAARKTPEFTAIADFAKSIQTRLYDKKQVDLAKKQLDELKKQREIQENRLKSIDEQLKKGIVRAQ